MKTATDRTKAANTGLQKQARAVAKGDYGRWRIQESIGEGGQAHVYKVIDATGALSGIFVLKRLKNTESLERRQRFEREVDALNKISHPNILRVVDHNLEGRKPFYVAEYCEHRSLEDIGAQEFKGDFHEGALLLLPIADALVAAHNAGVVHRDVKPSNILIRSDGTPVLGDFGICAFDNNVRVTLSDEHVGSVNFIAPEMESGQHDLGPPTNRTDVYCLGKVAYWMFSGGGVFSREDHRKRSLVDLLRDQRFEHVHKLLDRMVVREPGSRIESHKLKDELEMTLSLFEGHFAPLVPSVGIRCRFCGLGKYQKFAEYESGNSQRRDTRNFFVLGLEANRSGLDVRVLRCDHCGHIEIFQFSNIRDRNWWEK